MSNNRRSMTYVVDTNVLIDYVDIIPDVGEEVSEPENPSIDFTGNRLIIPSAVLRELAKFKKEHTERGKSARKVLRRIQKLFNIKCPPMREIYELNIDAETKVNDRRYALLPIHKSFTKCLPFAPSESDMDGQIILAGLAVACRSIGLAIDGTADPEAVLDLRIEDVVLITNDIELSERAWERGLMTVQYCHKYPEDYTGVRRVTVPYELYKDFINLHRVSLEEWNKSMPSERRLVANEFIVMNIDKNASNYPVNYDPSDDPYFMFVGRYDVDEGAIVGLSYASSFPVRPKSVGQAIYAEALMNDAFDVVICTGPAGSGKTFMSTIYGLEACRKGWYLGTTIVPCEVNKSYGALPGGLNDKLDPDVQPIKNALRNYLLEEEPEYKKELYKLKKHGALDSAKNSGGKNNSKRKKKEDEIESDASTRRSSKPKTGSLKMRVSEQADAIFENWFSVVPVDNAKGRDFAYEYVEYDEFQDQNVGRADMLIKRIGKYGKLVITGDINQIHAPYVDVWNNGIVYVSNLLYDCNRVAKVELSEEDVWRHPLVKEIARRQNKHRRASQVEATVSSEDQGRDTDLTE